MITLKVDLEKSNLGYGGIYVGDDNNLYMFNCGGDLMCSDNTTAINFSDFAIGTFKINDDKIITQTKEYYNKYYVCCEDKYEEEFEEYNEADDTDIEEEIQRVLVGLKSTDIYTNTYQALLSTLRLLIDIREKI